MGRPQEHDEAMGEALLDAAEALLATAGPDAVSVRAVAEAVGTTTRAVYSRFGSKDGLLQALAARGYELLAELVDAVPATDDPAADLVAAGVDGFRRFAVGTPHYFRLTFDRMPPLHTSDRDISVALRASYTALATKVERAMDARVIARRPVTEVAFLFHAACQGLASNELAARPAPDGVGLWADLPDGDRAELWREGLGALVRGLAPTSSRRPKATGRR